MNISNNHHLDPTEGDIPKPVPKEAREISAFFSMLVDETMNTTHSELTLSWIRCFRKGCAGIISSAVALDEYDKF
jgi:hypothetical protein